METTEKRLFKPVERIKEGQAMPTGMPPIKSPEEKIYFLLIVYKDDNRAPTWVDCVGRTDATIAGKDFVREGADLQRSLVLVDGIQLDMDKVANLYFFMKKMCDIYEDKDFDLEDFMEGDCDELAEVSVAEIPKQVSVLNEENFDVEGTEDIDV